MIASLTPHELEILSLAAQGKTSKKIARQMDISYNTVNFHFGNVKRKMEAETLRTAIFKAITLGVLKIGV